MRAQALGKPDAITREVEIINFLQAVRARGEVGAIASDIYQAVSETIGDTISRPGYYKLLDRLVAAGKIEQLEDQGVRRYKVVDKLHASNRLTLDDVYEMLPFYKSSETMARAVEARQIFLENRDTSVQTAAQALTKEPAVKLFRLWIEDLINMLRKDLATFSILEEEGEDGGARLEQRISSQVRVLRDLLYRHLSIPFRAVYLPEWDGATGLKYNQDAFHYDADLVEKELSRRVFGAGEDGTVIGFIKVDRNVLENAEQEMIVSGSDGSFHAGTLGIRTARGYVEDESFIVTFNNAVASFRSPARIRRQRGDKEFMHTAPLTRETIDDPAYKGMVLAPFMFPDLGDSEYEHMAKTASDVVQLRVDDEVISGKARDVATGEQIMPPRVHFRDGTITPQSRDYGQYCTMNAYGDIAREGIERSRSILQRIQSARRTPRVYAGAVKSTQLHLYSRLISWYIAHGSKLTTGLAIDPNWELSHANFISDVDAMTLLLGTLGVPDDGYWMSCVTVREFASLTEFYDLKRSEGEDWLDVLASLREKRLEFSRSFPGRGHATYDVQRSLEDLEDDSYLYLLEHADFASFYVGHTKGDQPPKVPRYEFLDSLRQFGEDSDKVRKRVNAVVQEIVTALKLCGFSQDRDHNFLSKLSLVRLVVSVIQRAHEVAKTTGKKLESEYKSIVVAHLAARRNLHYDNQDVDLYPVSVQRYMQRLADAEKRLPPPEELPNDR